MSSATRSDPHVRGRFFESSGTVTRKTKFLSGVSEGSTRAKATRRLLQHGSSSMSDQSTQNRDISSTHDSASDQTSSSLEHSEDVCSVKHTSTTQRGSSMVPYKSRPYYISPTHCTKPSGPYVSSEELRAFKLFIQEMAPVLTRYSGSDVWLQAVPQAAWKYAAVRHALVACSLVNEVMNYQAGGAKYGRNDAALIHMNKAIRLLTLEDAPTEVMLTIGLILQLLETLNHNARLAMLHLQSAVNILIEYKQQLADGRINNTAQADFILKYLDPTLTLAMKFAEQTIAKSIDADKIDQHSREAFAIRAQATQPDLADTFADDEDASNHLLATASKLMTLRAKYARLNTKSPKEDPGGYYNDDYHKHSPVPSAAELLGVSSDLEYFMRLYTPIYDTDSAGCRLLLAHAEILQMILQDTSHPPHEGRRPYDNEQGEKLLEETI